MDDNLVRDRCIVLSGSIGDESANLVISKLLFLQSLSAEPIKLQINSPGGSIVAAMAIYDTIKFCKCPVETFCTGLAAGVAIQILAAGAKGKRGMLANARLIFILPTLEKIEASAEAADMERLAGKLCHMLSDDTGRPEFTFAELASREASCEAVEALLLGVVDFVR